MELLLLLLLSPSAILCQRYRSGATSASDPNDEPFLPIYPVYPYSPKLMKRGAEAELTAPLTAELYAPKPDARDSYTAGFVGNYQRDPYYPSYNPYPKTSTGSFPVARSVASAVYSPGSFATPNPYGTPIATYGNRNAYTAPTAATYSSYNAGYSAPYPYTAAPYGMYNSYSSPYAQAPNPYGASPYAAASYPNYNYQPPYYYPSYYNQPYPPLPPPPHGAQDYAGSAADDSPAEDEQDVKSSAKKSEGKKNRHKDDDSDTNGERKEGQFVDGANYLSSGSKDLDGQSTSYKTPYNQLDQLSDLHLRSLPIPGLSRTTYRVISVGGQPVGPDYPLPSNYAKVQQLEQIMGQTLAKLLAQNQAAGQAYNRYRINEPTTDPAAYGGAGFVNKSPAGVIAKTGLAYVVNPANLPKPGNIPGQFVENYGHARNPVIINVQDPSHGFQQTSTVLAKAKYPDARYPQKSVTTVSLQQAPGVYIPPEAKDIKDENSQSPEYNDYDANPSQTYDNANTYKKNEQSYSIDQAGQTAGYQNTNLVTGQTPQTYQYSSYLPTQSSQQQQPRDYKTNLDEVNFPAKRNSKA